MIRGRAVGLEAKGNIESGLAHAAIALVIVGAQLHRARAVASRTRHRSGHVANLHRVIRPGGFLRGLGPLGNHVSSIEFRMKKKIADNLTAESSFILQAFRSWPIAEIVVT